MPAAGRARTTHYEKDGQTAVLKATETNTASVTFDFDWSGLMEAGLIIVAGLAVWLAARFLIARIVARAQRGGSLLNSTKLRWASPVLRNVESKRRAQRADTIGALLRSAVTVSIWTVVAIMVLDVVGINIAPLLASVGIVGIALGFGARELIRDAIAGLFITIEDQYGIGDVIEAGDTVGTVDSVGIRITRLVDERGVIWYIRNGDLAKVGNRSQGSFVNPEPAQPSPAAATAPAAPASAPAAPASAPAAPASSEGPKK